MEWFRRSGRMHAYPKDSNAPQKEEAGCSEAVYWSRTFGIVFGREQRSEIESIALDPR